MFSRCFDPTYCYDDPPVPQRPNTFYDNPPKGTFKYLDGETVRYTCENSVYRFAKNDGTPKKDWKDTLDAVCGWENTWDPPEIAGCVDPRGCKVPPARNDRIWGSYEDTYGSLEVGNTYWYSCRDGAMEMKDGSLVTHIDLTCINDPTGGSSPPYWDPPYDHDTNPFPNCVKMCKYYYIFDCK